ncbi:hypothetical protein ACRAWF_30055 [Streptomyces sp. L7]
MRELAVALALAPEEDGGDLGAKLEGWLASHTLADHRGRCRRLGGRTGPPA